MTYMSELAVFPDLSIEENIRVGAQALGHADPGARVEELYGIFPVLPKPPRSGLEPVRRPAQDARYRQGARCGTAPAGDG